MRRFLHGGAALTVLFCVLYTLPAIGWGQATPSEAKSAYLASDAIPQERRDQYSDLAVKWMQEYLRIDTKGLSRRCSSMRRGVPTFWHGFRTLRHTRSVPLFC